MLLFAGRTEYIEKYGRTAGELAALGLSTICIDWRGQGLANRLLDDRNTGHVVEFMDYQLDVAAMVRTAREQGLPEPFYLLGHSMGGCIGLRALYEGLPVRAAAFTAPMWGIGMSPALRPVAWALAWLARGLGQGHRYAPGTGPVTYVMEAPFEGNQLTTDPEMYAYMKAQLQARPDLSLGGPSLHWLYEALVETTHLARRPAPDMPCVTFLGGNERIVQTEAVHRRMAGWPGGRLEMIAGAEHEVLMETPEIRARLMADLGGFFGAASAAA